MISFWYSIDLKRFEEYIGLIYIKSLFSFIEIQEKRGQKVIMCMTHINNLKYIAA